MTYAEIIKLLDAGFTKEDIMKMSDPEPAPEPEKKEPETEPEKKEPQPVDQVINETMQDLKNMFADMRKEFTAMNIMNSRMADDEPKTGEEIIASIINPPKFNKKEGK